MAKKAKTTTKSDPGEAHRNGGKKAAALRDSIAIEAMQALLSGRAFAPGGDAAAATMLARVAYSVADAMLAERDRGPEPPAAA